MAARDMQRILWALVGLLARVCFVPDSGEDALPRYGLHSGQHLIYEGGEVVESGSSRLGVDRRTELWIVDSRKPGSTRAIVRQRHVRFSERGGVRTEQPERIDLYVVDLTPDGTIPQRSDDSFGVLDRVLPELPKNETELQEGWEFTGVDVHHRCQAAPTTEAGRFTFLIEQSSHMMTLNGFAATFTYDLDRDRGVITAIRASHRVRGREARTTDEQLIELGQLDAETLARLSGDVDVAVEAERHYQAKINAALTGDAPAEGPARLAEALQELTEARQLLSSDLFRDYVDRIIRTHHASEASYAQRLRAQERVIGQPAPAWTFDDLEGTAHRLSDYRGQVVVLDFWYRACGWCIRSMPQVQAVARRFADRPVAVLGMNVDRNVSDARTVVEQLGITTTTIRADQSIASAYGVRGYPTLFVLDQNGNMRLVHIGYSVTLEEELTQLIERLLAE